MKGTIVLRNPIKINGKKVEKLKYDTEKITPDDFFDSCTRATSGAGLMSGTTFIERDHKTHLYFGMYSVVEENKEVTIEDMLRITGYDVIQLTNIGAFFTLGLERRPGETSDETSEHTAEDSQSAPTKSEKEA